MTTPNTKIFGIGLSKTGTTSLARALEILGYRTKDYPGISRYRAGDLSSVDLDVIDAHDALTDTPMPSFYRELDKRYPGSKFILTVRDTDGWLKSCKKQFNEKLAAQQNEAHNQLFVDLYGCTAFDEQKFRDGYQRFLQGVQDYFKDRPDDLLILDVTAGEGWERLCPFLGRPVPDMPFPKANVTQISWMNIADIVAIAREAGRVTLKAYRQIQSTSLLQRALTTLRGGNAKVMESASHKACERIVERLRKLNPQIPALSPFSSAISYSERAKWNHVWLVAPLDGAEVFFDGSGEFTINIALIQDGMPLYGVVYAPTTDTTYYARLGQGAFVARGLEPLRQLGIDQSTCPTTAGVVSRNAPTRTGNSLALKICHVAEDKTRSYTSHEPSHEWQTAAAQLIATTSGKRVFYCNTGQAPRYNTEGLSIGCITVDAVPKLEQ